MSRSLTLAPPLPPESRQTAWQAMLQLAGRQSFQLTTLLLWALFMNREGVRVPNGNELIYLLYFYKAWHPKFLATDWTFAESTAGHGIFSFCLGWMTLIFPLNIAAWIGRFAVWTGTFLGLLRVGNHFKIPSWLVWLGIVLWLVQKQAPVTVEWMVGTFEAKCVAYTFLLLGIDAAIRSKHLTAGIYCGLAFSFHSAVGLWGGAAVGVAVVCSNPIRLSVRFFIAAILLGLPGLISSASLLTGGRAIASDQASFLVQFFEPNSLNPLIFPTLWLILIPVLAIFGCVFAWLNRDDRAMRFLFIFQTCTAIFFGLGVLATVMHRFGFVVLFPLRVHAVFMLLIFYWQIAQLVFRYFDRHNPPAKPPGQVVCLGVVLFFVIPNPLTQFRDMLLIHLNRFHEVSTHQPSMGRADDSSFRDACLWVQKNTAETDTIIAPPWRSDAFYFTHRPLIANWHAPRYDALAEWRIRIAALSGDVCSDNDCPVDMGTRQRDYFRNLSTQQIEQISRDYNANWLITTTRYPLPLAYEAGSYVVYKLR